MENKILIYNKPKLIKTVVFQKTTPNEITIYENSIDRFGNKRLNGNLGATISADDYKNYLEIYKRLGYIPSKI